jgi:CBS domain-containing protein
VGTTSRGVRASAASNATDYANILVTEVMVTNPLSIRPDTTVEDCIELLVRTPWS